MGSIHFSLVYWFVIRICFDYFITRVERFALMDSLNRFKLVFFFLILCSFIYIPIYFHFIFNSTYSFFFGH